MDGWTDRQIDRQRDRWTDRHMIWFIPCPPFIWDWELFPSLNSSRKAVIFVVAVFNMLAVGRVIKKKVY